MLNPKTDRLDYSALLAAPDNCRPDFAIATSYSLDLETLLACCLPLSLGLDPDDKIFRNRISLLHALQLIRDKVLIFCQAGQIYLPKKAGPLHVLAERMLCQLLLEKKNRRFPSFHPKIWLIRFIDDNAEPLYRLIVTSRNLTFDRSWDVSCALEGRPATQLREENAGLKEFLRFLHGRPELRADQKKAKIGKIIRELDYIRFETGQEDFRKFSFCPLGIGGKAALPSPLLDKYPDSAGKFSGLLIMSPFIDLETMNYFRVRAPDNSYLVTRVQSLGNVPQDWPDLKLFTMKDVVNDQEDEGSADPEGTIPALADLHAKLYLAEHGKKSRLWLGSMNATANAINSNVEFMLCLEGSVANSGLNSLTASLGLSGDEIAASPFQLQMSSEQPGQDSPLLIVDQDLRALLAAGPLARIRANGNLYECAVTFKSAPKLSEKLEFSLAPFSGAQYQTLFDKDGGFRKKLVFSGLKLAELSHLYRLEIITPYETLQRLVLIETSGIPSARDAELLMSIIENKAAFYSLLYFIFDEDYLTIPFSRENETLYAGSRQGASYAPRYALYEKMLRAAAHNPEKFDEAARFIEPFQKGAAKDKIPEEFLAMFNKFREALKSDRKRHSKV